MSTSDFIGLSKKAAQNLAERRNLIFRLIRVDAEAFLSYPEDNRNDRICVEVDDGKVTKVSMR